MTAHRAKRTAASAAILLGQEVSQPHKRMAQSSAQPWQDEVEELDILSGLENLPIWTSQAGEISATCSLETAPSVPLLPASSIPQLSIAEGQELLDIVGLSNQTQAQTGPADLPQVFSVPSAFVRDLPHFDSGPLPASDQELSGRWPSRSVDANPFLDSSYQTALNPLFPASQPSKKIRPSLPSSRSVDSPKLSMRQPLPLPLRSTASWQYTPLEGKEYTNMSTGELAEAQRQFSALDPPTHSGTTLQLQVPPQGQGPAVPIKIPAPGGLHAGQSQSPFDAPVYSYGEASDRAPSLSRFKDIKGRGQQEAGVHSPSSGPSRVTYRIWTNALPRRRSYTDSKLNEKDVDAKGKTQPTQRTDVQSTMSEGAGNPPSITTSAETAARQSKDSEDTTGAGTTHFDEQAPLQGAAGPQLMVHPGKLARFLSQLQTIQTKVCHLQSEREAVAQKTDVLERGSSMMTQLVDELEQLQANGAPVQEQEAKLKTATAGLKQMLASFRPQIVPPQEAEPMDTGEGPSASTVVPEQLPSSQLVWESGQQH